MNKNLNPFEVIFAGKTKASRRLLTLATAVLVPVAAFAQSSMSSTDQQGMSNSNKPEAAAPTDHSKMPGMDRGSMPGMKPEAMPTDHSKMPRMDQGSTPGVKPRAASMDHSMMPGKDHSSMPGMKPKAAPVDHSKMPGMDHGNMPSMKTEAIPMDHSKMPGMYHCSMPGMKPKAMPMDHSKMPGMDHGSMPGMKPEAMPTDHSKMPGMDHGSIPGMKPEAAPADHSKMPGMDHSSMRGMKPEAMQMGAMQGGSPPSDARDPDAYSNGLSMGPMNGMDMADNDRYGQVLIDRLEATHSKDGNGQALDAQAWYGTDLNKLWLKVDGERSNGKLGATRTEALWNHAITPYWGLQTGLRHDFGDGPGRTWAAIGVQGLSPYWFDVQATAYVGQGGRTAARVEAEYDILFTQRLIFQPNVKASFYGKNDPERGIGSGLSDVEAGLRLRYEVFRKFAPYIGVVWKGKFGRTADYAREAGHAVRETQVVAGVRVWF